MPHTYGIAQAWSHVFGGVFVCLLGKLGSSWKHKPEPFHYRRRKEKAGYQATLDSHGQFEEAELVVEARQ